MNQHDFFSKKVLIGFAQPPDKLVFIGQRPKLPVIANQRAGFSGNPPVEWHQVTITTKIPAFPHSVGQLSIHFLSNRGIATPV